MRFDLRIALLFVIVGLTGFFWGQNNFSFHDRRSLISNVQSQPIVIDDKPFVADQRLKTAECIINANYPDHECTPGAIFPSATAEQTCVEGYTKTVRNVSTSLKKRVYAEYNIKYPEPFGSYEADHFIPLALGGNNDIANLFPEAASPKPGFREKDLVEDYLHGQVCSGQMSLAAAQRAIVTDWVAVYKGMSPSIISELKAKYQSWAKTGD